MSVRNITRKLLELDTGKRIQFIIVFGSVAERRANALSDIDVAIYYEGTPEERFRFRLKAVSTLPENVDIQIFQDLPVAVQKEVLNGEVLYSKNFQLTFDEYLKVIQEYTFFEKYQNDYFAALEGAESGT